MLHSKLIRETGGYDLLDIHCNAFVAAAGKAKADGHLIEVAEV